MEVPLLTRQYAFNFIYEQVVNELEEVNLDQEIIYRSVPTLEKAKSEEHNANYIKIKRSYSY